MPEFRRSSFCNVGACVEVAAGPDGTILVRDSKNPDAPTLTFTQLEWVCFVAGAKSGEFDQLTRDGAPDGA